MKTQKKIDRSYSRSYARKQEAIKYVFNDILDFAGYNVIKSRLMSDYYGLGINYSESSVADIYNAAMKQIKEDYERQKDELSEKLAATITDVASMGKENRDGRLVLLATDRLMKLFGIGQDTNKTSVSIATPDTDIKIDFGLDTNNRDDE